MICTCAALTFEYKTRRKDGTVLIRTKCPACGRLEDKIARQAITRTTQGLRDRLFDLLDDLKEGDATPQEAQATARVVQQIHNTARLEMEAARFVSASQTVNGKKDGVLELEPLRLSKF
jgi:hypothetical protein